MFALTRLTEGLCIAFACLLSAFVLGAAFLEGPERSDEPRVAEHVMLRIICSCAVGFSLYGCGVFVLGLFGLLQAPYLAAMFLVLFLAGCAIRRTSPFSLEYWRRTGAGLLRCWDGPLIATLYVMLALSVPAVIVNGYGYDAVNYHLVYAYEWARSGRLVIDPFLQFPFYASNMLLLYAVLFVLKAKLFIIFLVWSMNVLAGLGVCAGVRLALRNKVPEYWSATVAIAAVCAVMFSPAYLRYLITAYVDTTIGAFAFFFVVCLQLAAIERRPRWLYAAAIVGGFFLGIKSSVLILAPVILICMLFISVKLRISRQTALAVASLFFIVASPWYIRNAVLAGDPIPPTFNIALHHHDGLMTNGEWASLQADFRHVPSRDQILTVPLRAFNSPTADDFRDDGTNALLFLIYLPGIALAWLAFRQKSKDTIVILYAFYSAALVAYWLFTSTLLRYADIFFPTLALAVFTIVAPGLPRRPWVGPVLAAIAILTVVPSPAAFQSMPQGTAAYSRFFNGNYRYFISTYTDDTLYLRSFAPGYLAEEFTSKTIFDDNLPRVVYVFGPNVRYYFTLHDIHAIGGWVGPASYFRLIRAVDTRQAADFLKSLDVSAVLISVAHSPGGLADALEDQLGRAGFCDILLDANHVLSAALTPDECKSAKRAAVFGMRVATVGGT
jgi:hypothetical protein